MTRILAALATLALAACAQCEPRGIVRTQTVYVPTPVHTPLPAALLAPCTFAAPDPACWRDTTREYCNGQLVEIRDGLRAALAECEARMVQLRALDTEATQ